MKKMNNKINHHRPKQITENNTINNTKILKRKKRIEKVKILRKIIKIVILSHLKN